MLHYESASQQRLDKQIMRIAERSDILRFLEPTNKFEELKKFKEAKWNYNPTFTYEDKHIPILAEALEYVEKLKQRAIKLRAQNQITKLMIEKCEEVLCKFKLLQAYHHQDRKNIEFYNQSLFWKLQDHAHHIIDFVKLQERFSLEYNILLQPIWLQDHESLDRNQVKSLVEFHLKSIGLDRYQLKFGDYGSTNMQVSIGPKPTIYIHKKSDYKTFDVCVSILHEIYGHLLRYKKWMESWLHILQWWTAHYLSTEEGIAVFQAARIEGLEISWKRLIDSYEHIRKASKLNRVEMANYYQDLWRRNLDSVFWSILRLKRWLVDTSLAGDGGVFYKDKVYTDGYFEVLEYLSEKVYAKAKWDNNIVFDPYLFQWRLKLWDNL